MAKYYVQSGDQKMVMNATDPQGAALWMVHRTLEKDLAAYEDPSLTEEERYEIALNHGLRKFDSDLAVNERGFDRKDSLTFSVIEIITVWHQLINALLKFESDQNLI